VFHSIQLNKVWGNTFNHTEIWQNAN
jgi:hypothetical protein